MPRLPSSPVVPVGLLLLALVGASLANPQTKTSQTKTASPTRAGSAAAWDWNAPLAEAVRRARGRRLLVLLVSGRRQACDRGAKGVGGRAAGPAAGVDPCDWGRRLPDVVRLAYEAGSGEGRHVVRRYNVVVFPTLLLLGPDAVERGRIDEPLRAGARLRDLLSGDGSIGRLEQQLRATPNDLSLRLHLLRRLALRGDAVRARLHAEWLVALDSTDSRGAASQARLLICDIVLFRSLDDAPAAQSCLRELLARYPRSAVVGRARQTMIQVERALAAGAR